jgi:hypothetical protein
MAEEGNTVRRHEGTEKFVTVCGAMGQEERSMTRLYIMI